MKIINEKSHIKHIYKIITYYLSYRVLLDIIYLFWASPIYSYMGLTIDVHYLKLFISYICLIAIIFLIPKKNNKVSNMILQLHFIIMVIPITTIYALSNRSSNFFFMIITCFIFQIFLIRTLPLFKIRKIKGAKLLFVVTTITLSFTTFFYLLTTQSINLSALDFSSIYDLRTKQNIASGVMNYLITWQYRVINPTIIVIAYKKKKNRIFSLFIGLQVLMYLMIPHKEVILSVGLILLILFISKRGYSFDSFFIKFISIISVTGVIIYELFGYLMAFGAGAIRLLYIPAIIKFWHYDFFSVNEKLFYSEGMIGKIFGIDYPYSVPSGFLMLNSGNANTGYIAYAYDNAGFIGMIIMSILFALVLKLIDSLAKDDNKITIFALLIYPMIILNDGDLLTLLLTGGLFILIGLLFIIKDLDSMGDKKW